MAARKITMERLFFLLAVFLVIARPTQADVLGQSQRFFIDTQYDQRGRSSVNAALKYVSERAYAYVEDDYWNGLSSSRRNQLLAQIQSLLVEFDQRIYPTEREFFGSEPNPGIDHDPRITILFTPLTETTGGYFATANLYSRSPSNITSNEREMVYLNITTLGEHRKMEAFLAHEFQHLIAFNQKEKQFDIVDDIWTNEMRSEYSAELLGYNSPLAGSSLERRLQSFLANPSDSLTEWKNLPADYGQVAVFGQYLADHWPTAIIADSLKSNALGIPSINQELAERGQSETFRDIFRFWLAASLINDPSSNSRFSYRHAGLANFRVAPTRALTNLGDDSAFSISDSIKDWQGRWYELTQFAAGQNPVLRLRFASPSLTSFLVSYLVFKTDGTEELRLFEPSFQNDTLALPGLGSEFSKVIVMPIKKDKISGFSTVEPAVDFTFTVDRVKTMPTPAPTPAVTPVPPSQPTVRPANFGLKEGDFIRAEGDINIYIVNDFSYKRLVLSPEICLQYGHLGVRGCFSAVKVVTPAVRDAFRTSFYFTNGETRDGKVYFLEVTGEDSARLGHIDISGSAFVSQGGDFNSVFLFNTREQQSYPLGPSYVSLPR